MSSTSNTTSVPPPGIVSEIFRSSVGRKYLVALTGFIAFGYLLGHMAGNLQIFVGQEQLNAYAHSLKSLGPLLWIIRAALLAIFGIHIWLSTLLKYDSLAARPDNYIKKATVKASLASRTMILSGVTVLAFVIYHLLHFSAHITDPSFADLVDSSGRPDVYSMIIIGFSNLLVSGFYILAVGLLCHHLSHGLMSMFQSLGVNNHRFQKTLDIFAHAFAVILFLGFSSVPVAVIAGWLTLPERM